ncbi:MAG: hypothetical protein HQL88_02270 [Magnetococcales bacterium]|nr:hypothetical protein [Magnetococcales bacterium]
MEDHSVVVEILIEQHRALETEMKKFIAIIDKGSGSDANRSISRVMTVLRDSIISHLEQEHKLVYAWIVHHGSINQRLVFQGFWRTGLELARINANFFRTWQSLKSRDADWSGFVSSVHILINTIERRISTEELLLFPSFLNDSFVSPLFLQKNDKQDDSRHLHKLTIDTLCEYLSDDDVFLNVEAFPCPEFVDNKELFSWIDRIN